jgi:predicted nucleic-acid-binding Zn-ribbon protein
MSEVKKCPKCGGEMEKGRDLRGYGSLTLRKSGDWFGDMIIPLYCKNCGFIELYNRKYIKKR